MPEFLLKEWKDRDGKIWRYFRNRRGEIDCRPVAPGGMGYLPGLYATDGLPAEYKQQVETLFMAPLDTAADRVHRLLLDGQVRALTDDQRSRWGSLIMSLWFRKPGDVDDIRNAVDALLEADVARTVLGIEEPVELPAAAKNQLTMEIMMRAIDDGDRGGKLINMHWDVLKVDRPREFFISDSPLGQASILAPLDAQSSCIAMPIAPTKLFVATNSPRVAAAMRKLPQRDLVAFQNRASVGQAEHFVGATCRTADKFIRAAFGSTKRVSLTRNIAEKYRAAARHAAGA